MDLRKLKNGQTIYMVNKEWGFVHECFIHKVQRTREWGEGYDWEMVMHYQVIFDAHKPVGVPESCEVRMLIAPNEVQGTGCTKTRGQAIRWAKEGLKQSLTEGWLVVTEHGNLASTGTSPFYEEEYRQKRREEMERARLAETSLGEAD